MNNLGLLGAALLLAGPALGWGRVTPALAAFYIFALGGLLSTVVAATGLVQAARGRGFSGLGRTCALVGAMIFVSLLATRPGGPMINDFTTDTSNPPSFQNAAGLPANQGRNLGYDPSFAPQQESCCSDLQPVRPDMPMKEAFALALATAREMPSWTVVWNDPQAGQIEAVSQSSIFGFEDDVAIRVRDGGGKSVVDMRSKSRDGRGDLGANAARIRAYVSALEKRL